MRLSREFFLYLAVSIISLCIDIGLLLLMAQAMHYLLAACLAFLAGTLVHYLLSVRMVFETRRLQHNMQAEGLLFLTAGLGGLLVNAAIIYACVAGLSLSLMLAKLVAAGGSFITGYLVRKFLLFS